MSFNRVTVVGAGAWGTTIARMCAQAGAEVILYAFEPEVVSTINSQHYNPLRYPEVPLPCNIIATGNVAESLQETDLIFLVTPSEFIPSVWLQMKDHINAPVISAVKGLVGEKGQMMHAYLASTDFRWYGNGDSYGVMAGPNLSAEIISDQPAATVVASLNLELARAVQEYIGSVNFRVYTSDDVIGVELGGVTKNVMAVASGMAAGLSLGMNTSAALLTRGIAELHRLGMRLGARMETIAGLAGLGDLIATALSSKSRNYRAGYSIARGEIQFNRGFMFADGQIAEGISSAPKIVLLAEYAGIEMPICSAVNDVITGQKTPQEAMLSLLKRPLKDERM